MDKIGMREWIAALELVLDNKLKKWKKESRIENGEAVQIEWQFGQTHIIADIFWQNDRESVHLQLHSPRTSQRYEWHGLTDKTFNKIMDRVGNWAQITMYPPEDYVSEM
jgi:hypothetical protein